MTGAVRGAAGAAPQPPLVGVVPWGAGALAGLALLALAGLAAAAVIAPALREDTPPGAVAAERA